MLGLLGAGHCHRACQWLQEITGRRGMFELLTLATIVVAALVYVLVLRIRDSTCAPDLLKARFVKTVIGILLPGGLRHSRVHWIILVMQSLWAQTARHRQAIHRQDLVTQLFQHGASALAPGFWNHRRSLALVRHRCGSAARGCCRPLHLGPIGDPLLPLPIPPLLPWMLVAMVGAATVLSYAVERPSISLCRLRHGGTAH